MRKSIWASLAILTVVAVAHPVFADSAADYASGAGNKLGRGVINATTGWVEIPKQTARSGERGGAAGAIGGFFKGIGLAVTRSVAGAYEIGTFWAPIPNRWAPVMRPTTVFSDR